MKWKTEKTVGKNQWNQRVVLWLKLKPRQSMQREKVANYQRQDWKRRYHYRSHTHHQDNKGILQTILSHKFNNWYEMDQFLKKWKLLQFTQYETDNLSSTIIIVEFEFLNFKYPKKKTSDQIVLLENFTKCFKN